MVRLAPSGAPSVEGDELGIGHFRGRRRDSHWSSFYGPQIQRRDKW